MDLPRLLSTTDVPSQFLKSALLVGCIPFKALRSDPRVSYTLYVPPDHLNPDPSLQHIKDPAKLSSVYQLPPLPLVVSIHGTGRAAESCRNRLISFANSSRVAVLAPLFPAGIDSFNDTNNYKLLRYKSLSSDKALLDILNEVKLRWPGIQTEKVFMIGFSGGGQFTHRFLYLYPERLHAVSVGAPGRATMLDEGLKWPEGIKDVSEVFDGAVVDKSKIGEVHIHLVVGGADDEVHGGTEFWAWLANKKREMKGSLDAGTGSQTLAEPKEGRVSTLRRVKETWESEGIQSQLDVVEGVKHDSNGVFAAVLEFLRPLVEAQAARKE